MSAPDKPHWLDSIRSEREARSDVQTQRRVAETHERARAVAGLLGEMSSQRAQTAAQARAERLRSLQEIRRKVRGALADNQRKRVGHASPAAPAPAASQPQEVAPSHAPPDEQVDDLMQLEGLSAKEQRQLYIMGITSFQALAEVDVGVLLEAFGPGCPVEEWREQARQLAEGDA